MFIGEFPPQERIWQEEKSERLEGRRLQPPQGPAGKDALENLRDGPGRQCQEPGGERRRRGEGAQEEQVRLGGGGREEEDLRLQEQVTVAEGEGEAEEQKSLAAGGQGGRAVTLGKGQALLEVALPKGPAVKVKV